MLRPEQLDMLWVRVSHLHFKYAHGQFAPLGFTEGQPKFIHYLREHSGCSQSELAQRFYLEPATVTAALNRMEKAKLIERRTDMQDLRVTRIYLTEEGQRIHGALEEIRANVGRLCFDGFSPEELEQMEAFLKRMQQNLCRTMEPQNKDE